MKILSKDDILEANDLVTKTVEVPEWGGSVMVRSMNGTDRDAFESTLVTVDDKGVRTPDLANMRAKLVAMTVVDESGNRMFDEKDIGMLARKSAAALERVFSAAQELNGMSAKTEEEAVKNSEAGQSEDSISA